MLPERYLRATDAARMERHFRLLKSLGDGLAAVEWRDLDDGQCTELTVAASLDRPGLFAALAGTLTAQGVNILSVDLFTREDGRVLDTFRVSEQSSNRPVRHERRARIEASVIDAVSGRLEVEGAVDRWRTRTPSRARRHWGRAARGPVVRFDNESSSAATVIEVRAQDQPGLAYTIADGAGRARARHHVRQDRDRQGARPRRLLRDRRTETKTGPGGSARGRAGAAPRARDQAEEKCH